MAAGWRRSSWVLPTDRPTPSPYSLPTSRSAIHCIFNCIARMRCVLSLLRLTCARAWARPSSTRHWLSLLLLSIKSFCLYIHIAHAPHTALATNCVTCSWRVFPSFYLILFVRSSAAVLSHWLQEYKSMLDYCFSARSALSLMIFI